MGREDRGVIGQGGQPVQRGELGAGQGLDLLAQGPREELMRRPKSGEVVVFDVRPEVEYAAAHIPGAISVPAAELAARLADLPADVEVVAYCRGAYCVLAHEAVRQLRAHDRKARTLGDGMLEWRLAGLPVISGVA